LFEFCFIFIAVVQTALGLVIVSIPVEGHMHCA